MFFSLKVFVLLLCLVFTNSATWESEYEMYGSKERVICMINGRGEEKTIKTQLIQELCWVLETKESSREILFSSLSYKATFEKHFEIYSRYL